MIAINIQLMKALTKPGETIHIVGNLEQLGNWNVSNLKIK